MRYFSRCAGIHEIIFLCLTTITALSVEACDTNYIAIRSKITRKSKSSLGKLMTRKALFRVYEMPVQTPKFPIFQEYNLMHLWSPLEVMHSRKTYGHQRPKWLLIFQGFSEVETRHSYGTHVLNAIEHQCTLMDDK